MIKYFSLVFSLFFAFINSFAQTYISNVTIVDVENKKLIPKQTVIIKNETIDKIGDSNKIIIPDNLIGIDGTGKYLMPGMTDAHVHFFQSGGLYARPDAIDLRDYQPYNKEIDWVHNNMDNTLKRYLQCGITNVIDVGATYNFLKQRDTLLHKNYYPSVQMTGPLLTTWEPPVYENLKHDEPFSLIKTVEDAKQKLQEQLPYKPDFIKIWYIVKRDTLGIEASAKKYLPIIKAVIEEAHKNNLKVAVHATERITAQLAIENGCDFLVHSIDDEIISDDFINLMKSKKIILCPTLTVHRGYIRTFTQNIDFNEYELLRANPYQLGSLLDLKHLPDTAFVNKYKNRFGSKTSIANSYKSLMNSMLNLKRLSDADVLIATGTDAGNIGTLHASSYLSEIKMMQEFEMDNWKIIQASTINGAKVLNKEKIFGSIVVGKKANMILLDNNPVENIENITKINRVINNGIVFHIDSIIKDSPSDLAQRQLNAYNLRNIEAFLEPYDDSVEIYTYPDKLMYIGKETMRKNYSEMFQKTPNLHCELKERIVQGNIVIDKERVQFANKIVEAVAIYHVENNKIKKVYFIR